MRILIGIDDTDNLESRGTGHRARQLGRGLSDAGLATCLGITRHQLLVDPAIPYTSHNSSACLLVEADDGQQTALLDWCRDFLLTESAPGSDAGLCIARAVSVVAEIQAFGDRAKIEVLTQAEALRLGQTHGVELHGLTGTGGGVIGALAAVGLRAGGDDGRFLWLPGLRELEGVHTVDALGSLAGIAAVETIAGALVDGADRIDVGPWARPLLKGGRPVLLVEEADHVASDWRTAPKDLVKRRSE